MKRIEIIYNKGNFVLFLMFLTHLILCERINFPLVAIAGRH